MKILIVEDDAAIRLELARFLEKYGYTCLCPADFTGFAAKADWKSTRLNSSHR